MIRALRTIALLLAGLLAAVGLLAMAGMLAALIVATIAGVF